MNYENCYKPFREVSQEVIAYLKETGYGEATLETYQTSLRRINAFLVTSNLTVFNSQACEDFVKTLLAESNAEKLPRHKKDKIRCANAVIEYQKTGSILFNKKKRVTIQLKGKLTETVADYLAYKQNQDFSKATIDSYTTYLSRFCDYLTTHKISEFSEVSVSDILGYLENLAFCKTGTVSKATVPLKGLFRYLYEKGICPLDYSYSIPTNSKARLAKLPETYSDDDVKRLLESVDRSNPKGIRNYALLLVFAETGLRSSDVCGLKFEHILWEQNLISLVQYKTGSPVNVPLLPVVGNAIIHYLKYVRPKTNLPNVFISLHPPYRPMTSSQIRNIVLGYLQKSGIAEERPKMKKGPHALRHSLAARLLDNNTPLPLISDILGHTSTETTSVYLGIDIKSLRQCALEVPESETYIKKAGDIDA